MGHVVDANKKGLWYFAHPYTVRDAAGRCVLEAEDANYRLCCRRAGYLIRRGYNVFAPICHSHPILCATPALRGRGAVLWYVLDNQIIERCDFDGIILAPGWQNSAGCRHERELFKQEGLPVLTFPPSEDTPT